MASRDFQIFLGLCIAALSAAVIWVAVHSRDRQSGATAALTHRIDVLQQELTGLKATANTLAQQTAARLEAQSVQLQRLSKRQPTLSAVCLTQVQAEIDDIRAFIAYGSGIRRRVSASCAKALQPRFGG